MISYDGRVFTTLTTDSHGEVGKETLFHYTQEGDVVQATYAGGDIVAGHLIAKCNEDNSLDMVYHHINIEGVLKTGECRSVPEILEDGRLRLHEEWQWTCGNREAGVSVLEEIERV